ncbi:MAG: hypothetical protein NTY04_04215 [Candidatus Staskawiczbacteria bacterium]|nr:hypothetical protein [Candidatus Staskawiczbacteria bacterium]
MEHKKQLRIAIITVIVILIFFVGWGLGVFTQMQFISKQVKTESAQLLGTKVISSVSAYGKVTKIQNKNITLSSLSEDLVVSVPDTARVYSFVLPAKTSGTPTQKIVTFKELKIGDSVNANLKLLSNGQFEAISVIILPAPAK